MTTVPKTYHEFLEKKRLIVAPQGLDVPLSAVSSVLFPFQQQIVKWAVRKGRAAIFADTGLGKTAMQVEWARLLGGRSLILAPLSVVFQTIDEAQHLLGIDIHYTRSSADLADGMNITNYDMIDHFNAADFDTVVLDE